MYHNKSHFFRLIETVKSLRGKNGCPWDKRQTTVSLVKYLQSEFDELLDANLIDYDFQWCGTNKTAFVDKFTNEIANAENLKQ